MDQAYWKERCDAAEAALRKARTGITVTDLRRCILDALSDLRPESWMDTHRAADVMQVDDKHALAVLRKLDALVLVERIPGQRGVRGGPSRWRLGYLVQVAETIE
ncbi:hypothetical protein [Aquabacterium sp.]|uniref:hypothetical protein n=1 Tax=Aquabacterium sp. TaxID=1872578 RepID=UPI0025C4B6E1|nr:hypothetical protein [Aquabacterium sp.]